jgi:hypothetical protein
MSDIVEDTTADVRDSKAANEVDVFNARAVFDRGLTRAQLQAFKTNYIHTQPG